MAGRAISSAPTEMPSFRKKMHDADVPDIHADIIKELHEAFALFDSTGSGDILMSELVATVQSLGFQEKNPMMFDAVLKMNAKRKGGNVSFVEFAEDMAEIVRGIHQEKDLRIVFNMLDSRSTGRISLDDLKRTAKELGETISDAELLEMMDVAKHAHPEDVEKGDEQESSDVSFREFFNLRTQGKLGIGSPSSARQPATKRSPHRNSSTSGSARVADAVNTLS